jgi:hypothetical protein
MNRPIFRLAVGRVAFVIILTSFPVWAGEVNLSWDPSANAAGYRVHRGTGPGDYSTPSDEGNTTSATIPGLADCVTWYFAVTAYNAAGESGFSTEVASFPRAWMNSAAPSNVEQGAETNITVSGLNFRPGDVVTVANSGVQVDAVDVSACNQLTLTVTVASDAPTGAADVTITHPSGVAATGVGLLMIEDSGSVSVPDPPTGVVVD